ncbi:MAG: acyl-CoA dehydrogenase family protein [Candidatus Binatia bacterium]|nr:acyl-CoA dehydrogenase family protein [Candidatus Binatia bacterium]
MLRNAAMDFAASTDEQAFRASVRTWLEGNLPSERYPAEPADRVAYARRWARTLHEGGWAGLAWPVEYGGRDLSPLEHLLFAEEYAAAGAPPLIDIGVGPALTGPTLIHHGTEEQKARFLTPILNGEEIWCQGFSEPGAGSDLASLQTRGVVDGDDLVINGQKVWTSYARFADWCILIVRTNPHVKKHRGLTFVLLDMKTPGITIRPLVEMTGVAWFNEVFFEDVRVPKKYIVGEIDKGWDITITTLSVERGASTPYPRLAKELDDIVALGRRIAHDTPKVADPRVRQRLAQLSIEIHTLKLTVQRSVSEQMRTGRPGPEGSILKLLWSELEQRLMEAASEISGAYALLDEHAPQAIDAGRWQYGLLWSRAASIYAGTSEVQRNILSQRVLGLPRG